jgi:hypothetical protein
MFLVLNLETGWYSVADMKGQKMKCLVIALLLLAAAGLRSQDTRAPDEKTLLLAEIAGNMAAYQSKTVTLRLRLKYVDRVFERITFYDRKNNDIEFDISSKKIKEKLAADMLNIHEGLEYNVTFVVEKAGTLGGIIAELKGFKPIILDAVPGPG